MTRKAGQRLGGEAERDCGAVVMVMPILAVAMLSIAGLVVDGGAALAARGRATDVAQQAARAGADALAPGSLRRAGPQGLAVDAAAAQLAANRVLTAGAVDGQVSVAGDTVTVTAQVSRPTAMLSAVGVNTVTGRGSATATALYGDVTEGGPR